MPPEYHLGIGIAAMLVVLLGMFLQHWLGTRFVVLQKSSGTDQLANQLSRIADSLEKLVVHLGVSPPTEKLPVEKPRSLYRMLSNQVKQIKKRSTRTQRVTLAYQCLAGRPPISKLSKFSDESEPCKLVVLPIPSRGRQAHHR
jgi:hypothetical protein